MSKLREGYKQTKVGVIPEEWEVVRLEEVSDFITKGATPTTYGYEWQESGIPFLRSECVSENGLNLKAAMFISEDTNQHMKRSEIKTNDLLMTITGNVGRVILLKKPFVSGNINQHIARIRISSKDAEKQFIYYFISQSKYRINYYKITTGQAYPQISLKQVRDSIVPLPPLKEQQKIAQTLSTWDSAISKQEALIQAKEQLKKGLMQKLLSGEVRFKEFGAGTLVPSEHNDTHNNGTKVPAPDGWEVVKLGDIIKILSSKRVLQKDWQDNGIPFYRTREIISLSKGDSFKTPIFISEELFESISKKYGVPKTEDLLVTGVGSIGETYIVGKEDKFYFKDGNVLWFKMSNTINSNFLSYLFKTRFIRKQLFDNASITTVATFTIEGAKNTYIVLPPLKEQQKIAQVLNTADKEIALLKEELEALKEQKRGLMQRLLSGDVRVVV